MFRSRLLLLAALLSTLCLTTTATLARQERQATETGTIRVVPDRVATIDHIKLDVKVDLDKRTVDSKADIAFRTLRPTEKLTLDAVGFKVKKVTLGEGSQAAEAKFTHDGKKLVVDLGGKKTAGQPGELHVEYFVEKPRAGLHFFAPTQSNPDIPLQVWSQGETTTNRYWVPCIDDPDVRQSTRIVATVKKGLEAVSNGKLVSRTENNDGTVTFDWNQEIPHSSYLITLVVGEYDVVQEEWEGMPVIYYLPKGYGPQAKATYGRTPEMLTFLSQRFGIRYPWVKYAQVTAYAFNGAMENTSATTMFEGVLRDERMLLDGSHDDFVVHELTHQWWGDMVTCRDWSHLWLNEGFATYGEALWDEHVSGREEYDLTMFQKAPPAIQGGRTRPVMDRRYLSPDAMFDGRSYPKGGWILHMLRRKLGDDVFFRGLKEYGNVFRFQNAETTDFRRSMERTSGRSLDRFFYDWLERSGTPTLSVKTDYKPDTKAAEIVIKQTQAAEAFYLPLRLALYCQGSTEPVIVEEEMTGKELTLKPVLPGALERIDVDPEMAFLADVREIKSLPLWEAQLRATSLPLRMRAVRYFAEGTPAEHREMLAAAFAREQHHAVKNALANLLGTAGESVCRDALVQGLADKNAKVRAACVLNLGKFKNDDGAINAVRGILAKGDPSYGVENAAMETYAKAGRSDAISLITPYLEKGSFRHNTQIAALNALAATRDGAAFDPLLAWAGPDHPRTCRAAARRGLSALASREKLDQAKLQQAVSAFVAVLEKEPAEREGVLTMLPSLGKSAAGALPTVEKLSKEEGTWQPAARNVAQRLRDMLKKAETPGKPEKAQKP